MKNDKPEIQVFLKDSDAEMIVLNDDSQKPENLDAIEKSAFLGQIELIRVFLNGRCIDFNVEALLAGNMWLTEDLDR